MSKRYIFIIFILVSIVFALLLLPKVFYCSNDKEAKIHYDGNTCTNVNPKGLLLEAINTHRYIDPDKLASLLVGEDPSYVLVDLRDATQFKSYSLPNAINIPYKSVLQESFQPLFSNDDNTYILFANGTILSDQVWSMLRKKGYTNLMVLKGGLNDVYKTILNPTKPLEIDSKKEQDLYHFRKAAGIYFGLPNPVEFIPELIVEKVKPVYKPGRSNGSSSVVTQKKKTTVKAKPKPKVIEEEEEGC